MTPKRPLYAVHPGVAMTGQWIATLPEKTGRSVEEWIALLKKSGPPDAKGRREWLKSRHGLGTNTAVWLAERAEGKGAEDSDPEAYLKAAEGWVEAMYSGAKAPLRPIYDALLDLGQALGPDVKACPGKTSVPLYRRHVFAQIKPSTRTRIDLGLALGRARVPSRLLETGGLEKGDRITHRIPIASLREIDAEVKRWMKTAYLLDSGKNR
jgi:hypothetical protein